MNFYQRMGILPLKKRVNRDKCSFTTKQRMFGVFAIDEILCYRWTPFVGSRTLCHPGRKIVAFIVWSSWWYWWSRYHDMNNQDLVFEMVGCGVRGGGLLLPSLATSLLSCLVVYLLCFFCRQVYHISILTQYTSSLLKRCPFNIPKQKQRTVNNCPPEHWQSPLRDFASSSWSNPSLMFKPPAVSFWQKVLRQICKLCGPWLQSEILRYFICKTKPHNFRFAFNLTITKK